MGNDCLAGSTVTNALASIGSSVVAIFQSLLIIRILRTTTNTCLYADIKRITSAGFAQFSAMMISTVPPDYRPTEKEPFMNDVMLEYFRQKLASWKNDLMRDAGQTLQRLQEQGPASADQSDRATAESERSIELRTRDRARKLIQKIDEALQRIENGNYGYCSETGDPISIKRLEARPIATLGLEAQETHERMEKTQRDG